ncbi:MAG: beta strand repeat-containing protein [Usitatibacter sp.]
MSFPSSASGWTNSGNALANDGAYADWLLSRSEGGSDQSGNIIATGFGFSAGSGDTVNGITVVVRAMQTNTPVGQTLHVYLLNGGTPVGSEKTVSLSGSFTDYTFGSSSDTWGAGFTGANIANLQVGCYTTIPSGSAATTDSRIDSISATVSITDTTPNSFSFTDQTNVALSTTITSNSITVSGISAPSAISVTGGQYEVNGSGSWLTSAGTVNNGDSVRVRHTSSSSNSTAVNTTLTIGGVSDTFTSTTAAADTTPDAFSFTDVSGVNPSSTNFSNTITISGINAPTSWSLSGGGGASVNGSAYNLFSGTVNNGDTIAIYSVASSGFSTAVNATLTVGGVSDTYTVTTRAADTTPDAFAFTDQSGVSTSTVCTSNAITVSGIEAAAAISISGDASSQYQINGGSWVSTSGSVNNGDSVKVRNTSSASLSSSVNSTLTIGGVSDTFTTTTVGADSVPDAFSFTAATRQRPGRLIDSNAVTITGINVAVGVTCSAGALISVNGGGFSTTGTITNGQTVKVRVRSSSAPGKTITATVTIGGVSGNFLVTTLRSSQPDL